MSLPSPLNADLDATLRRARHLILDFNGPVCQLYSDQSERLAADQLRAILAQHNTEIPDTIAATDDPLAVLTYATTTSPQLAVDLDAELTRREINAALAAQPAAYSHDLISSARESHRTLTVVSTCSDLAVRAYLDRASLDEPVSHVVGRTAQSPDSGTGHNLIIRTLNALSADPGQCALIAESADILDQAAESGIAAIAYTRTARSPEPRNTANLAIRHELADLVLILRAHPLPN